MQISTSFDHTPNNINQSKDTGWVNRKVCIDSRFLLHFVCIRKVRELCIIGRFIDVSMKNNKGQWLKRILYSGQGRS